MDFSALSWLYPWTDGAPNQSPGAVMAQINRGHYPGALSAS
jgi:hypothetical protein